MRPKLAVIIPTMNRPDFVIRAIRWYEAIGIPVFIGDSSPKPQFPTMFPSGDFTYYAHTPGANEIKASYLAAQTMLRQSNIADIPYLAWAGDDDFLLPRSLDQCSSLLDSNPGVTSATGYATIFATVRNGVWNPIESVVGVYPDLFFRVFRRDLIIEGWESTMNLPTDAPDTKETHVYGACVRSTALLDLLAKSDHQRRTLDYLSLLRQVHPLRVTAELGGPEPWRAQLGHAFPRLQYLKQCLESWCWHGRGKCMNCELMLPSLRSRKSRFYSEFSAVEWFLKREGGYRYA